MEQRMKPPKFILIPIGYFRIHYNRLLPDCYIDIDDDYIVWQIMPNPELECEVIYE